MLTKAILDRDYRAAELAPLALNSAREPLLTAPAANSLMTGYAKKLARRLRRERRHARSIVTSPGGWTARLW